MEETLQRKKLLKELGIHQGDAVFVGSHLSSLLLEDRCRALLNMFYFVSNQIAIIRMMTTPQDARISRRFVLTVGTLHREQLETGTQSVPSRGPFLYKTILVI